MLMPAEEVKGEAKIKVVGVGGCGCNAIDTMVERKIKNVDLIAVNTDAQVLEKCLAPIKIQAGKTVTRGLGSGARPEQGQKAVEEVKDEIAQYLSGSDMVFIAAGMGKGTGTGGSPVVAEIAKKSNALVVAIVTTPFEFEGKRRKSIAEEGLKKLREYVDTLIVVSNEKLLSIVGDKNIKAAMDYGNEVLYNAVRGIIEIIVKSGFINVDFGDVRTIMKETGDALIGTGIGRGEHRASEAAQKAISNPLLDGISPAGARGVLINITAHDENNIKLEEIQEVVKTITQQTGEDANLIYGVTFDEDLKNDELMVTVIATGIGAEMRRVPTPPGTKRLKLIETTADKDLKSLDEPAYSRRRGYLISKNQRIEEKEEKTDKPPFLKEVMD